MAKKKIASNIEANIRWFAKMRHIFNFSGTDYFGLKKVQIYKATIEPSGEWEFMSEMAYNSFCSAYNHNPKSHTLPKFGNGKNCKYQLTCSNEDCVQFDRKGVDAIEAYIQIDSYGVVKPTRHPRLLLNLLKVKASVNLHIQMYAEDRASGILPKMLFEEEICIPFNVPNWFREAVENQQLLYYK